MTAKDKPHHHGALRPALIDAARAILAEGGTLTLRQAAARAGVSHAAPAHHFGNLSGLLTEIATEAFADFTVAMERHRDALPIDATDRDRLAAICRGYLDFARNNGGLFSLMFNADDIDRSAPELSRVAQGSYDVLAAACAPFAATPKEAKALETAVWSLVHGYAQLRFEQMAADLHPVAAGAPTFDAILDLLLAGVAAQFASPKP